MPRCCSVAGCKSNYKSQNESISTFSLPKDEKLREMWLRKIPTDLSNVSKPVICAKHFPEESIIRTEQFIVDGEVKTFARTYPKLKPNAVPSIFPNLPEYLSTAGPSCRRLCDVETENFEKAITASLKDYKQYEKENAINNLSDVLKHFSSFCSTSKHHWTCVETYQKVVICFIDISDDIPNILGSVSVKSDLSVALSVNQNKVPEYKVPKQFLNIKSKHLFDDLLKYLETLICDEAASKVFLIENIVNMLKYNFSSEECPQLQFLVEQITFLTKKENSRRYSGNTLLLAASVFVHSSSAYVALHKSGHLYLPHPCNLRKLIGKFDLNSFNLEGSMGYLKVKKQYLKEHELVINVLLDEIYIEPHLTFKGDTIFGVCNNDTTNIAKTTQVFMISSIFSKYRDVVSIIPVHNLTAHQLKCMLLQVIKEVEKLGFVVLSLISDNNAVNRKAYELITSNGILQPCIDHPLEPNRKLFLIFDTVHILKCVRNNWITKNNRILKFPDFNNFDLIVTADFKYLELMYKKEKDSLVKFGHLLSWKVMYPSNIQKQNVNLALRIFDERNIAALKCMASNDSDFAEYENTALFIQLICQWWNIVNVKGAFEGQRFNNKYREPIRKDSSFQLEFLRKMSLWLKIWRQTVPNSESLSSQTFQSLINTLDGFLLIIPYIFEHHKTDYILLSKFQNDSLEGRFSSYRQLSGANYYISYIQLLEGERKLRFKETLLLNSQRQNIPLRTLLPCSGTFDKCVNIEKYSTVLLNDFDILEISENILPVLMYISGYAVKKNCFLKIVMFAHLGYKLTKK